VCTNDSNTNADLTEDSQNIQSTQYWQIEKIIAKRIRQGKPEFRVKWLNFESKFNSWVKYDDLNDECKQMVSCMPLPIRKSKRKRHG
jgi:hypothetical protein